MMYYVKEFPINSNVAFTMQEWFNSHQSIHIEYMFTVQDVSIICIYQKTNMWEKRPIHVILEK